MGRLKQTFGGTAIKMADDAASSKLDTIKCRDDNPAAGGRGPYRGAEISRQCAGPENEATQAYLRFAERAPSWLR